MRRDTEDMLISLSAGLTALALVVWVLDTLKIATVLR